jgi:hypothetical protein
LPAPLPELALDAGLLDVAVVPLELLVEPPVVLLLVPVLLLAGGLSMDETNDSI